MFTKRNWDEIERLESEIEAESLARLPRKRAMQLSEELHDLLCQLYPASTDTPLTAGQLDHLERLQSLIRAHRTFEAHAQRARR